MLNEQLQMLTLDVFPNRNAGSPGFLHLTPSSTSPFFKRVSPSSSGSPQTLQAASHALPNAKGSLQHSPHSVLLSTMAGGTLPPLAKLLLFLLLVCVFSVGIVTATGLCILVLPQFTFEVRHRDDG